MKTILRNCFGPLGVSTGTIVLTLACVGIAAAVDSLVVTTPHEQTPFARAEQEYYVIPAGSSEFAAGAEVIEFFSYGCAHCAEYQTQAIELQSRLQGTATFRLVPVIFNPQWEAYSRAFFAAQVLGVQQQSHQLLFDDISSAPAGGRTLNDLATKVFLRYGVPPSKFVEIANSAAVTKKLDDAYRQAIAYGVDRTPTITVNGKYRVVINEARGITPDRTVELAVDLLSR